MMGDYGFGLLQTAGSGAAPGGGGGGAGGAPGLFRSSAQFPSPASALFLPGFQHITPEELLVGKAHRSGSPTSALLLLHGGGGPGEKAGKRSPPKGSPQADELGVEAAEKQLLPTSPSSSSASSCSSAAEELPPSGSPASSKAKLQMEPPGGPLLLGGSFPGSPELSSRGGEASPASLAGFGTPWSVQTSSPPPPPPPPPPAPMQQPTAPHPNLNALQSPEPDGFYPGLPSSSINPGLPSSSINPAFFHSFSPVSGNPCPPMPGFSSPFSGQMGLSQQQQNSRRSPVSPQLNPHHHHHHQQQPPPQHQHHHQAATAAFLQQRNNYNHHQPMVKQSPWSSHQGSGWSSGGMSWGGMHGRDRRTTNMGIPGTMNQISPLKKPFSGNVIAPPKFPRSTSSLNPKSWIDDNVFRTDNNSNSLLPLQDRSRMYDSLNMHSLENSLIEIMRAEHDPLKGRLNYPHPGTDSLLMLSSDALWNPNIQFLC